PPEHPPSNADPATAAEPPMNARRLSAEPLRPALFAASLILELPSSSPSAARTRNELGRAPRSAPRGAGDTITEIAGSVQLAIRAACGTGAAKRRRSLRVLRSSKRRRPRHEQGAAREPALPRSGAYAPAGPVTARSRACRRR